MIENFLDLKLCPYWRNIAVCGDRMLVLCGAESAEAQPLSETDIGPRERVCMLFKGMGLHFAYTTPYISEVHLAGLTEVLNNDPDNIPALMTTTRTIIQADKPGIEGISDLESRWEEELQAFYQRHGQTS